ncbi:MAG TPA: TolC family outer membrane protein [Burkholderiaceae bacterium]|jgi:protease secretion system outer membrane protein
MHSSSPLKRIVACLLCAGLALPAGSAFSMGLLEAYDLALRNDPAYQSAIHDNEGGRENRALARSNLLPNITASYSGSKDRASTTQPQFGGGQVTTFPRYLSSNGGISLRQPLFSPDGIARYQEGNAQADYSDVQFVGKQRELVVRLVGAYLDALFASDYLNLVRAQRDTLLEQKQSNDRMFKAGEGTRTDMLETQAKLDLAEAQLIEATDSHASNYQALQAIVGTEIHSLDGLLDNFKAKPLEPADFESWRALALQHNPDIAAQRIAIEIARDEVSKNRAGHMPKIDFVASVSKQRADTIDTYTSSSNVASYGIELNMPIYAGGSVSALTRQASAAYEKAKSDLDDKTNQIMLDMHKQHYAVLSSIAKVAALEKSVESAKLLVTATKQSIKGGVRVNLDLLNALQQQYVAQRDLAQARYGYLVADLKLRADAGVLGAGDLRNIAAYFGSAN